MTRRDHCCRRAASAGRDVSAVDALEPLVDPGDEQCDPLEVAAIGATEHTVQ